MSTRGIIAFRNGEWVFNTPYRPQGWRSVKQVLQEYRNE